MKILLAVDGSEYTKKMLAYLTTHDELFSTNNRYTLLTVSAQLPPRARAAVGKDMVEAYHPQTIIAHLLNGEPLPEKNGAPLRARIERQLGYKHAKYLTGIEAVASLDDIGKGKGGFWEDLAGYQWYAGI